MLFGSSETAADGGTKATPEITCHASLDAALAARVLRLADACEEADGVAPLNEQAKLRLGEEAVADGVAHVTAELDGDLVGYAQLDSAVSDPQATAGASAQFMVSPKHRRRGIAWQLAAAVGFDIRDDADATASERYRQGQRIAVWSFGHLPSAQQWAERYDVPAVRQLLIMSRPASEPIPAASFPEGYSVRPFREDDMDAFLDVNARAFAHHPEQGQMSADDVRARMQEDWFDPQGFLVCEHEGSIVGFHWTKQHSPTRGEVYVIGVHPDFGARGLGRQLLHAGMTHLVEQGVEEIILYVEGDQDHVVRLYQNSGFTITNTDVLYEPTR